MKKDKLLWMAGEITIARRRIREAVFLMQHDEDKDFFTGCYQFEKEQFRNFDRFYLFESPEFITSVHQGDHDAIEEALLFLEADPYCFRSGYIKKKLCRALKQASLTQQERFRIRALVLKAVCVQRPVSFADFAALACRVYTPGFHARAEKMKIIPFKYIIKRRKLLLSRLEEERIRRSKETPITILPPDETSATPATPAAVKSTFCLKMLWDFLHSFLSLSHPGT